MTFMWKLYKPMETFKPMGSFQNIVLYKEVFENAEDSWTDMVSNNPQAI